MKITLTRKEKLAYQLQRARRDLMTEWPYFGILSMYLQYVATGTVRTVSTNGRCFFFNPNFLSKLTDYETEYVICHQILHIVFGDIWRDISYQGDEYHRAFDLIVNRKLCSLGWNKRRLPHLGILQTEFKNNQNPELLSVDEIYRMFSFRLSELGEWLRNEYIFDSDFWWDYKNGIAPDGVVILNVPAMTKYAEEVPDATGEESSALSAKCKVTKLEFNYGVGLGEDMHNFWVSKSQIAQRAADSLNLKISSHSTPNMERTFDIVRHSSLRWRDLLANFIQEEIADYSFSPPDRRFSDCDFYLPDFNDTESAPRNLLFMVDTSASITREDLGMVFSEIKSALEQFSGKVSGLLGFFDSTVVPPRPFASIADISKIVPFGGGGTDFEIIFDYIFDEMSDKLPSAIIIFTDGFAKYPPPEAALNIPVLWLINNTEVTPPFGRVGRILPAIQDD